MERIEHNDTVFRTTWWIEEEELQFETGMYVVRSMNIDGTAACELISQEGENGIQYSLESLFLTKTEAMADAFSSAVKSKYEINYGLNHLDYLMEKHPERFV